MANPFGVNGHESCVSDGEVAGERRVGQCYNEIECVTGVGGVLTGYCDHGPGSNILVSLEFLMLNLFKLKCDCFRRKELVVFRFCSREKST